MNTHSAYLDRPVRPLIQVLVDLIRADGWNHVTKAGYEFLSPAQREALKLALEGRLVA